MTDWSKVPEGTEIEDILNHWSRCKFVEIDSIDPNRIRYKYYLKAHCKWFYAYGTMDFFKLKPKVLFEV
jgi:hypothetical protein